MMNILETHNRIDAIDQTIDLLLGARRRLEKALLDGDVSALVTAAATEFRVPISDVLGPSRHAEFVEARHVAMYLACADGHSVTRIGRHFGRDHSSVIHARKHVEDLMETEPHFRQRVEALIEKYQIAA